MNRTQSEELHLVTEQVTEWLQQSAASLKEREERLNWLMESPLHIREALAALVVDDELRQLLDPDHRIDAHALVAEALNNLVAAAGGSTDVRAVDSDSRKLR